MWRLFNDLQSGLVRDFDGYRMLTDPNDENVSEVIRTQGMWEPKVTERLKQLLREGDVFVDAGAHIGYYTCLAASRLHHTGSVYSFEASPKNFSYLYCNVLLNRFVNVAAWPIILLDEARFVDIQDVKTGNTGGNQINREGTTKYPAFPLDSFLSHVDVAKIDCEGTDDLVILGGKRCLRGARAIVYEGAGAGGPKCRTHLEALGFTRFDDLSSGFGPDTVATRE